MIIISKYIIPRGYVGITLFPFIFLKRKEFRLDKKLINHESIHLRQQTELLILPFYFLYIVEFLVKLLIYKNWNTAYRAISFEREAYTNEQNLKFLKKRPFWNFMRYF